MPTRPEGENVASGVRFLKSLAWLPIVDGAFMPTGLKDESMLKREEVDKRKVVTAYKVRGCNEDTAIRNVVNWGRDGESNIKMARDSNDPNTIYFMVNFGEQVGLESLNKAVGRPVDQVSILQDDFVWHVIYDGE